MFMRDSACTVQCGLIYCFNVIVRKEVINLIERPILAREPKSESPRREKMLENASILFWKKGYSGTSMRDIAKACKCKPSNIYNFFHNKEEILFACLYAQNLRLYERIKHFENDTTTKPTEQLREFIHIHIKHVLIYRKTSRFLFDTGLERLSKSNREKVIGYRDIYDRILVDIINRGIKANEFSKVDVKLATRSIASMIVRTIIWFSSKGPLTADDIAEFVYNFSVNGLRKRSK